MPRKPKPDPAPPKPRPAGRPKSRPAGAFARLYWATEAEHAAIRELLKKRRALTRPS